MFPASMCPSSGETTVFMQHLVLVSLCGWLSGMHTRQSSTQSDKYQMSYKHSCFSWWWAHSRPKHVEIEKYTKNKLCTKLVLITTLYRDVRSSKHKTESRNSGSTFRTVWRKQKFSIPMVTCTDIYKVRLRGGPAEQHPGDKTSLEQLEIRCQCTQVFTRERISPKITFKNSLALSYADKFQGTSVWRGAKLLSCSGRQMSRESSRNPNSSTPEPKRLQHDRPPPPQRPVLSPSSTLPPSSSHFSFIPARKNLERVSKVVIYHFFYLFQYFVCLKLRCVRKCLYTTICRQYLNGWIRTLV